jgi:hypothetical protein
MNNTTNTTATPAATLIARAENARTAAMLDRRNRRAATRLGRLVNAIA